MRATRPALLFLGCLLLCGLPPGSRAGEQGISDSIDVGEGLPRYDVVDPDGPAVTEQNLLERDALWPFWVDLTRDWQPAGRERPFRAGTTAVVVRVESGGKVRLDFGRHGTYTAPVDATDVVERANQVARGELRKLEPNLLRIIGSQVIQWRELDAVPVRFDEMARDRAFLIVFADPMSDGFADLSGALAKLPALPGLRLILVPQGKTGTGDITRRLRALGWPGGFTFPHTSPGLTRSLVGGEGAPPPVLLQSPEGRVAFEEAWSASDPEGFSARLGAALDAELGATLAQDSAAP
jgi:hypothetical protein